MVSRINHIGACVQLILKLEYLCEKIPFIHSNNFDQVSR